MNVVAFTVAEFILRQVISLQQLLTGFPLISGTVSHVGWQARHGG